MGSTWRVLVIGGRGHFGAVVVRALRASGFSVHSGGRDARCDVHVDLAAPASFAAFNGFDAVVDCADGCVASPLSAARHCLRHGGLFIETSANSAVVEALLRLREEEVEGRGLVVVSLGIFPGVSDLLLQAISVRSVDQPVLSIMLDVLSGAGRGMVQLMVGMLGQAQGDQRGVLAPHTGRARRGEPLPFAEQRLFSGAHPPLTQLVAVPGSTWVLRLMNQALRRSGPCAPLLRALYAGAFYLGRGLLLRRRPTRVELVACRQGAAGFVRYTTPDGLWSGGLVIAAALTELLQRSPRPKGVVTPAQVLQLEPIVARLNTLGDPGQLTRS